MKSEADAERAIRELDGKDLQGRPLKVNEAKARDNN
jgi:RNA recognition motif-containing protein